MKIEDNLSNIHNIFFHKRENWKYVTDEMKSKYSFIFNRFLSKEYPEEAEFLNHKLQNKISVINLWFSYMKNKPYPSKFWSKSSKVDSIIEKSDFNLLKKKLSLNKDEDLIYLINNHFDIIKEELKWYKKNLK